MTTYNYNVPTWLRGQVAQLFTLVRQRSFVRNMFGSLEVPSDPALKEIQGQVLMSRPNTHVGKELGSHLQSGGLYEVPTKFPTWWVYTDIAVTKTLYDSKADIALPSNLQAEFSNTHNLVVDQTMAISNADECGQWPGLLNQSSGGAAIVTPSDCCTAAGTANTGTSWVGSQATAMAFITDVTTMLNNIIGKEDAYGRMMVEIGGDGLPLGEFRLYIHPMAYQHLKKPVWNGTSYLATTYEKYIQETLGVPISYWKFAATGNSSAYTGAEDATTVAWMTYNAKNNFFMGTIASPSWEADWGEWLSEDRLFVKNRFQEKIMGFIRPYDIDGTYFKAQTSATITPWNNAA